MVAGVKDGGSRMRDVYSNGRKTGGIPSKCRSNDHGFSETASEEPVVNNNSVVIHNRYSEELYAFN